MGWVWAAVVVWVLLAVPVAAVLGGVIGLADRREPEPEPEPEPAAGPDRPLPPGNAPADGLTALPSE